MLDDLRMIHERDSQDALGTAERQWQQLDYDFRLPDDLSPRRVYNVVCAAAGSSVHSAKIVQCVVEIAKPFEVVQGYDVPAYTDESTLFIAACYAGDSDEVLSALEHAAAKGATIVVVTSGGTLADIARERGYRLLLTPHNFLPRFTVVYFLKALVTLLEAYDLTPSTKTSGLVNQQAWLREVSGRWRPESAVIHNEAKQIAQELLGKSIVVYAGTQLAAVAHKWKADLNCNAKYVAWSSQYPDCNHSDFVGWSKQPVHKPYAVIDLRSDLEHDRVQRSFVASEKLLSGVRPVPVIIKPLGDTVLQQALYASVLGDFVSIYLALLSKIDPGSNTKAEQLKKELE